MLETAGILAAKTVGVFACGVLLGVGFWAGKKFITGPLDEKLAERRLLKEEKLRLENTELAEELGVG